MLILAFVLVLGCLTSVRAPQATAPTSKDVTALAQEAYGQLAQVYRSGGNTPELVGRLNDALELIQEARIKRLSGDQAGAVVLEEQARVVILGVMSEIPSVQQKVQRESPDRIIMTILCVPVVVVLSTFVFYVALRTWRWYEKARLFEMRIVENKKESD